MALLINSAPHSNTTSILKQTNLNLLAFSKPNPLVVLRKPHLGNVNFAPSPLTFTVKCRQISQVARAVETVDTDTKKITLIDGLEPAIYTPPKDLKRSDFPRDFIFGASTSALQTEGRGDEGGRGPSTWDFMIQANQGRMAVDSYHLYKEDVKLLKNMGMNAYRFSIAWPRILPKGTIEGGINQEGIDFYNDFLDELIDNGITPVVTLFHFDLPVEIQKKYYGFMHPDIVEYFKQFADLCFEKFGNKVKYWSTINEPYVFGSYGYKMGLPSAELSNDPMGPYIATHNIILAHAATVKLYKEKYQRSQKGKIGICLPTKWYEPHNSTDPKDFAASRIQLDYMLGWYMDPLYHGDYPESMKRCIKGLPEFTKEQKEMVQGAYDYIGLNYYTARYSKHECTVDAMQGVITIKFTEHTVDANGNQIGWQAHGQDDIFVHPDGLRNLILYMKERYGNPVMYVTENGVPDKPTITASVPDLIAQGKTDELSEFVDNYRCQHAEDHLTAVREAFREGANVKGYFVWSLMDNMEVGAGYDTRFGLNFTDYFDNHKRYPKLSAKWFSEFLEKEAEAETETEEKKKRKKHHHLKVLPF